MKRKTIFRRAALIWVALVLSISNAYAWSPEPGLYNRPGLGGTGVFVELINNYAFVVGFVYDRNGNPTWITAGGELVAEGNSPTPKTFSITSAFAEVRGGQCIGSATSCPYKNNTPVPSTGTLSIVWLSPTNATLDWGYGNDRTGPVVIERFPVAVGGNPAELLIGDWDFVSESNVLGSTSYAVDRIRINASTVQSALTNGFPAYRFTGCVLSFAGANIGTADYYGKCSGDTVVGNIATRLSGANPPDPRKNALYYDLTIISGGLAKRQYEFWPNYLDENKGGPTPVIDHINDAGLRICGPVGGSTICSGGVGQPIGNRAVGSRIGSRKRALTGIGP